MRNNKSLKLLSLILTVLLCIPTFLTFVSYALDEEITPDAVYETGDETPKFNRSNVVGYFGDTALSTAYYGVAPYGGSTDDITYLSLIASYTIPAPGYYTVYKTKTATGNILNKKPVWTASDVVTKTVEVKMYYSANCSVTGCDGGAVLLNGEEVSGDVKLYRGTDYTFSAKKVDGYVYTLSGAEDGVQFKPSAAMTVRAEYVSDKYATVTLNVGEGGDAEIVSGGNTVTEKIPEGAGFSVDVTPDVANGYYIESVAITKNGEPIEGESVDAVVDGEAYEVTVTFAKAEIILADMQVNLIDVEDRNFEPVEDAIIGAVTLEPEEFANGAEYKVEYVAATLLGNVYQNLNFTTVLPTRHEFGQSVPYGDIKAGNTETVRVTCKNPAFPGITLVAEATATLTDLRIPTEISSDFVIITYGDDLKAALCNAVTVTGEDGKNVEFSSDDITTDPETLDFSLLKTQEATVKYSGNRYYAASEGTATVYVKQASSSIDVKSESITYGETPALEVITEPEDLDYIMLIAGVDADVTGFISLYVPKSTRELMKIKVSGITVLDIYEMLSSAMADGITFGDLKNLIVTLDSLVNTDFGNTIAESMNFDVESLRTILGILSDIPEIDVNAKITLGNPPKNAGVYLVAAVSADLNYKLSADIAYLTIAPKTSAGDEPVELRFINELDEDLVMTVNEAKEFGFGGTLTVNGNDIASENIHATYFGYKSNDSKLTFSGTPVTEPGVYTELIYAIGGNYLPVPISRVYAVGKNCVEIDAPELTVSYDGKAHVIEYTVTPETVDPEKVTVTYVGENYNSSEAPVAVGEYDVYLSFAGDSENLCAKTTSVLKITKAEVTVDVFCNSNVYYGQIGLLRADPIGMRVEVSGVPEGETFVATPYVVPDDNYPHVGEYTVSAYYTENGSYNVTVNTATFKIIPRPVEIVIDDAEKTYGDENPEFTFKIVDQNTESDAMKYGDTAERAKIANIAPATAATRDSAPSDYDITANVGSKGLSDDYEIVAVRKGTLTVTPKSATVTIINTGKVYGTEDPELPYTVDGMIEGDDAGIVLTREAGEDVGTYEISGSSSTGSYSFTFKGENGTTGNFTITEKKIIVKIKDATKVNGAEDPRFTITVTDVDGNPVDPDVIGLRVTREEGEEEGEYRIVATVENENYVIDGDFPAEAKLSILPEPKKAPVKSDDGKKSPQTGYGVSGDRMGIVFVWVAMIAVSAAALASFKFIPFKKKRR